MYDAMINQPGLTLIPICREGEAIAIAAGLIIGGKKVMVLHQNTGFFETGDSLRCLMDTKIPLLLMIGYRGWRREGKMTDSAAIYLEPILDTWGIKHYLVASDDDVAQISSAYKETNETNRPVAILIGYRS